MATNKHATIRYLALDRCFSNFGRKFYIDDLVDACNDAIQEFAGIEDGVKKRQVYEDIKFMESSQGWNISLEKKKDGRSVYFRYSNKDFSIGKNPLSEEEANQVKEVLDTLSKFKGMPQFDWVEDISTRLKTLSSNQNLNIIEFEQNKFLKGLEFITPFFNAINYKRVLKITYQPYNKDKSSEHFLHPYYLKQYNQRWFLFAWNEKNKFLMNIALDRVIQSEETNHQYLENTQFDFQELFEDVIGVTIPENANPERILLRVMNTLLPYIKTKPLHGSQRIISKDKDFTEIELTLINNYEFESLLLSFGDRVSVIKPDYIRKSLEKTIKLMIRNYK